MERFKVKSSQIEAIGRDAETDTMEVEFKGKNGNSVYRYDNITVGIYTDLICAESIGSHFGKVIKANPDRFPFKRISGPESKPVPTEEVETPGAA